MIRYKKQITLFSLIFVLNCIGLFAEDTTIKAGNWFTYFGQFKLTEKFGILTDLQFRMDANVEYPNQNLLRIGALYYYNENIIIGAGYAYVTTHNLDNENYPLENRIWEQILYVYKFSDNINMSNRLRLEQRFIDNYKNIGNKLIEREDYYDNRIRYSNRTIFNIYDNINSEGKYLISPYFVIQNEIFVNFPNKNYNNNLFDQNRLLLALGIVYNNDIKFELGYMNQYILSSTDKILIYNNLHFSIITFMDLK